jgi:hypothetical protein
MEQFILLHSRTLSEYEVNTVVSGIEKTGAKVLDRAGVGILFEGDMQKAKELIATFIGDYSITPVRHYDLPDPRPHVV